MNANTSIIKGYYESWAKQDKKKARMYLSNDNFTFLSPQDSFSDADHFIEACWKYSQGLVGVTFRKEVYDGDQAFLIMVWQMDDTSEFASAEYVKTKNREINKIIVINNNSEFITQLNQ